MIPLRITGATRYLGAPNGWEPEKDGACSHLAIRDVKDGAMLVCESAWEPTPHELDLLNAGGRIVLRVAGGQPPVCLYVEDTSDGK